MPDANSIRYFDGSVSIVTGAASGIGKALAFALTEQGGRVILCDLQEDLLAQVHSELVGRGANVEQVVVDVRNADSVRMAIVATKEQFGRIDLIFNNAGIVIEGTVDQHTLEDWNRIVDINLKGVVYGVHNVYPIMKAQGFGHIVNTASLAGLIPVPKVIAYTATKHAVVGLTRVIRIEGAQYGIRATAICPGQVRTPILHGGKYGRVSNPPADVEQSRSLLEPAEFASHVLKQVKRNKRLIVEPFSAKRVVMINKLFPSLYERVARAL